MISFLSVSNWYGIVAKMLKILILNLDPRKGSVVTVSTHGVVGIIPKLLVVPLEGSHQGLQDCASHLEEDLNWYCGQKNHGSCTKVSDHEKVSIFLG